MRITSDPSCLRFPAAFGGIIQSDKGTACWRILPTRPRMRRPGKSTGTDIGLTPNEEGRMISTNLFCNFLVATVQWQAEWNSIVKSTVELKLMLCISCKLLPLLRQMNRAWDCYRSQRQVEQKPGKKNCKNACPGSECKNCGRRHHDAESCEKDSHCLWG